MTIEHHLWREIPGPVKATSIYLTGEEVATAIIAYLAAHSITVRGPRTITVNHALCDIGKVYVDPSGAVYDNRKEG
jgi:hypothetical protein